MLFMLNMTY